MTKRFSAKKHRGGGMNVCNGSGGKSEMMVGRRCVVLGEVEGGKLRRGLLVSR